MYAPIAFGSPRYECVMGPAIGHEAIWLLPVVYMYRPGLLACSWPAYSARGVALAVKSRGSTYIFARF